MPSSDSPRSAQARLSFEALFKATREMTPVGAKGIPECPKRDNLLARPIHNVCRICHYPGHQCDSVKRANSCRVAIMSTIRFWEDMADHIICLYRASDDFHDAIDDNVPTYAMRLDSSPLQGNTFEQIFVNRLTRNYLRFQSHYASIRPKAMVILNDQDRNKYEMITRDLNEFLLKSSSRKSVFILFDCS